VGVLVSSSFQYELAVLEEEAFYVAVAAEAIEERLEEEGVAVAVVPWVGLVLVF
jgi:hypothetical protein